MTHPLSNSEDAFAVTVAVELDRVCTQFDRALRDGKQPKIESFLGGVRADTRDRLLANLLMLEMEHRVGQGDSPLLHDYQSRFPDDLQLVKSVFVQVVMPTHVGRFEVERVLGKGGFGRVYLAYDRDLKRHVAIKCILGYQKDGAGSIPPLLQEAQLAARLKHPAIVPVYEVGKDDNGGHFVVLEYIDGITLKHLIREDDLSLHQVLSILTTVADALQYAHERGLTHRDLKPANILIDRQRRPYIADFGLAIDESMQLLRRREIAGTPPYMAPEQAAGETHRVDGRTDIWAFGVILYEILTKSLPFSGDDRDELFYAIRHVDPRPPRQRDGSIPVRLERIALTCLAKRMSERYSCAADLLADLRLAQGEAEEGSVPLGEVASGESGTDARVVPKGLRSFDAPDAAFFLRLLPDPRDTNGVPESIRFWQSRLNETNEDATFPVGLVYGPSGCGKTSLVKAGLLPLLDDHVVPIFVESTRDDTELRLLKAIRKVYPAIPNALSLPEIIAGLREANWKSADRKIVIFLDQFEQWLHANPMQEGTQLADALRQCDGGHVQAVLLVRDDFWMQLTRLLRVIEVPLVEDRNSASVDLFDTRHAANVLAEFGVAYGRLPEQESDRTQSQRDFIEQAVSSLAVDGRVIPVRLALFVEMIKNKPWTAEMLKEMGGAEGTGVAFLDESFASPTAAPEHRLHQASARAVLECLLPPEGTDIRGNMRSEGELLDVSGYGGARDEFERLVDILDGELRLVTPTDPAGQAAQEDESTSTGDRPDRHYQLTHDYLVPAIRAWLTRNKRTTARGRAELRLTERADAYRAQSHTRQLPNLWEWLSILWLTRGQKRNDPERHLLHAASRYHTRRLVGGAAVIFVLAVAAYVGIGRIRATGYVRALATAETQDVPRLIRDARVARWWSDPQLQSLNSNGNEKERLHAAMALLPVDAERLDYLLDQLLSAEPADIDPIRTVVFTYGNQEAAQSRLWSVLGDDEQPRPRRLRAAAGLTTHGVDSQKRWTPIATELFNALVDEVSADPSGFDYWLRLLRPIRDVVGIPAAESFGSCSGNRQTRYLVAAIIARFNDDRVEKLVEYVLDADNEQFRPLESAILRHSTSVEPILKEMARQTIRDDQSEAEKDRAARRRANAAVSLFEMGQTEAFENALLPEDSGDRRVQSRMIERFSSASSGDVAFHARLQAALRGLETAPGDQGQQSATAESRYAQILIVGDLAERVGRDAVRSRVVETLQAIYETDPDPGVHSAAEWALRQWGADDVIDRIRASLAGKPFAENGGWLVDSAFHTMVLVRAPATITIGSPEGEPGREKDETQRQVRIPASFLVSTTEITQREMVRLLPELKNRYPNDFSPQPDCPANDLALHDALRYCRKLSEEAGIPEKDMCYPRIEDIDDSFVPDLRHARRTGYRLLTHAEWEYVCRAGSSTPRFYGFEPALLDRYAWYLANSEGHAHPVGMLRPNRLGLFDVYGNVREWTVYSTALFAKTTTALGGSFSVSPRMLRSANWRADRIGFRGLQSGFRIGRTFEGKFN